MNIFMKELKSNRKALIIWSVCIALLVMSGMGKYTVYSSGGASSEVFDKFPNTMKVLLGISGFEVTKISGFFAFLFPYIEITVAIHAALLGSGIIAKEERDKTTEFLIAKPVSRRVIITSKLLAALVNVVVINIVSMLSSLAIVPAFSTEVITGEILILHLIMFIVQLIFLTLGALLSASLRKPKISGSIATNIIVVGYIISKVTDLVDPLKVLNIFSPFKYFNLQKAVNANEISIPITLLCLVMIAVFTVFTYFFYQRRDMNI
ncbi:MAG TPA: ABC transporter permease subunit [Mobilitalea sp.]|nr:ABC transporter permease subunit [Mobilitalea sp.]